MKGSTDYIGESIDQSLGVKSGVINMQKKELLNCINDELLDKLFGFCYARTDDSYEAQELCSDIVFALVKSAHTDGEIKSLYSYIWRIARNVYADFSDNRRRRGETFYEGDAGEILPFIPEKEREDDSDELLGAVYRRIAFLTKAYREVMILYYLDGLSTAEIAKRQKTSEGAVRQRLFSARQKLKGEVEKMEETCNKPVALGKINYNIWGTGNPGWGDPQDVCHRMFSKHVVWLCHQKPMSASEIAAELNVPTVYVEEELEILEKGVNGKYGLLRRLDSGKYGLNFILFDKDVIEQAQAIYAAQLPKICDTICDYIEQHKEEYLSLPYLNKKVDLNLILWQQITDISHAFSRNVESILKEKYFPQFQAVDRPFSVFGYVENGKNYGGGWDSANAENVCGFAKIHLDNIYTNRIVKHFNCGLNVSENSQIQLALRAIDGLDISSLSETEKEHAVKAIKCGYLYREGDVLYTKILVNAWQDRNRVFSISMNLDKGYFEEDAQVAAEKLAALIRRVVPDYLLNEWRFANVLAELPVLDSVIEVLIDKGILIPPEDGIGAEGCWMSVLK